MGCIADRACYLGGITLRAIPTLPPQFAGVARMDMLGIDAESPTLATLLPALSSHLCSFERDWIGCDYKRYTEPYTS